MAIVYKLLVIQKEGQNADTIREFLHHRGYQHLITSEFGEIPRLLRQMTEPVLIGFCGEDETNSDFMRSLIRIKEALRVPLLFIGKDGLDQKAGIEEHFRLSHIVTSPHDHPAIAEAVAKLLNLYAARLKQEKVDAAAALLNEQLPDTPVHELYTTFENIPNLLFDQLSSISNKTFETNQYIMALKEKTFQSRDYMPKDIYVQGLIQPLCKAAGKWGAAHIHRTAFLTHKITEALNLDEDVRESTRVAAFLWPISFGERLPYFVRKDYLMAKSAVFRRELCSKIKDSAMHLATDHRLPDAGQLVATMGKLVGREIQVSDSPDAKAASAIMCADMVDRACWQLEYWNPRSVGTIMRRIKSGELSDIHPTVLSCIVSFLTQAQSPKQVFLLVPRHIRNNRELKDFAQSIKDQKVDRSERKVPLSALQPGMRLARPVFAFDGEQILSEDIVLDEDLIWRIWEISAVRPINAPLVVTDSRLPKGAAEGD